MVNFTVNLNSEKHTLKGGMGASWHSMSKEIQLENYKCDYPVREVNPGGSAYGGNSPVSDTNAWDQIFDLTEWLSLNWLRVELSQRMYEPVRKEYDWDNK